MSPKKKTKKTPKRKKTIKKRLPKRVKKVKKITKKPARKKSKVSAKKVLKQDVLGVVTHYFPHVKAAVVKVKKPLSSGQVIRIKGHTTDFTQTISSMQIEHVSIQEAKPGDEIGLLVESRTRRKDIVCKP